MFQQRVLSWIAFRVLAANGIAGVLLLLQPSVLLLATSKETLGQVSLLISWSSIGIMFSSFGLYTLHQRLGNRYLTKAYRFRLAAEHTMNAWFRSSLFVVPLFISLIAFILQRGVIHLTTLFSIVWVTIGIAYTRWIIIAARRHGIVFWPAMLDQPTREFLFLASVLLPLYFQRVSTTYAIFAYTISTLIAAILLWYFFGRHIRTLDARGEVPVLKPATIRLRRKWRQIALTSFPSELGLFLLKRLDVVIVGTFVSATEAGLYFLVSRLSEVPTLFAGAINTAVGPELAKLSLKNDRSKTVKLFLISAATPAAISFIVCVATFFLYSAGALEFLGIADRFYLVLTILQINITVYFLLGPTGTFLTMFGHQHISSSTAIAMLPLYLLFSAVFTALFGVVGTAATSSAILIIQRTIELYYLQKILFRKRG